VIRRKLTLFYLQIQGWSDVAPILLPGGNPPTTPGLIFLYFPLEARFVATQWVKFNQRRPIIAGRQKIGANKPKAVYGNLAATW
jgi:hypothetical protein